MKNKTVPHERMDTPNEAHILGDHPVLDMLNTGGLTFDGCVFEYWRADIDVLRWLERNALSPTVSAADYADGALAVSARGLREVVRKLICARKMEQVADPEPLNSFLRRAVSHVQLLWPSAAPPGLIRVVESTGAERILLPLIEAAAELLVHGDFNLVRQCEHQECVYWFYDLTKGHRRRWCSMALCGNRHKVARYRERHARE